jgi:UDP-glucose 4-epimerase
MKILVTGGAGYIGSHMLLALQDKGYVPVVIDNLSTGFRDAVPEDLVFYQGNIDDETLVARIIQDHAIDTIIHFAASTVVPESVVNPLKYYENNTGATTRLIKCAVAEGVQSFIFSSTAAVYGTPDHNPVTENTPTRPESPYGASKLMSEWVLRDACAASQMRYGILRYFNVAGADPQGRAGQKTKDATHLVKVVTEAATGTRSHVDVYGTDYATPDGTGVRDYIHVSDLVGAHLVVLENLKKTDESLVVNCGYGYGFSVLDVIKTAQKIANQSFDVRNCPRRAGDMAELIASSEKLKSLGWVYQYDDLETIVQTALAWERKSLSQVK